jgi:TolB-like protein/DNA-binding winged helix-turn-helix (wHTH) protein/Tfp pilus assembly protein PilF
MKSDEMPSMPSPRRYEFGDFRVDGRQGRLFRRDGTPVAASPRVVEALVHFAEHPGETLEKGRLMEALWPGVVVEENNLNQLILTVRRALGDDPQDSRYVQTIPRRGFRFVAAVRPWPADAATAPATPTGPAEAPASVELPAEPAAASHPGATPTPAPPARPPWPRRLVVAAALAVVALAAVLGGRALLHERAASSDRAPAAPAPGVATLAVLPFKPVVAANRDEAFEAGMADSLIARLSTLPGVAVRAFSSVRHYAGVDQDPLAAARELHVDWVVEGTFQRAGDEIRVTARLLRASDGAARWSGTFDERYRSVFDVQDAIADRVARVVAPRLDAAARTRLAASGTHDVDAYQLYLAARAQSQDVLPTGLRRSVELYRRAIEIDPAYALAYAGLAETYRRLPFGADVPPAEAFEPARAAALRAIELDPSLGEGYAGLGWVKFWYEFDWAGAEAEFRRALDLNPNISEAQLGLGHLLSTLGRTDEGLRHIQRARELDPLSPIANTLEAGYLLGRGRRAEADERLRLALEIAPRFWVAHMTKAGFELTDRRPDLALRSLERAQEYSGGETTQALSLIGARHAANGQRAEAQAILDGLLRRSRERYVPPTSLATVYAALGRNPEALDALERAYDVRDLRLAFMKSDPRWNALRGEPRFAALLARMKLDTGKPGATAH